MKAHCEECGRLVEITPGDVIQPGFTARWWRLVLHAVELDGAICDGSGRNV